MTQYYAVRSDNWDAVNLWNEASDGSGAYGTPTTGDRCSPNTYTVTLNQNLPQITNLDDTGTLLISGSRTFSANLTVAAGLTLQWAAGSLLTVTSGGINVYSTITMDATAGLTINSGAIWNVRAGTETYAGTVTNNGIFRNLTSGSATFTGTYTQATGTLSSNVSGQTITFAAGSSFNFPTGTSVTCVSGAAITLADGSSGQQFGNWIRPMPATTDVRNGTAVGNGTGSCVVPAAADVRLGTSVDATTGTLNLPAVEDVEFGVSYDNGTKTGTLVSIKSVGAVRGG